MTGDGNLRVLVTGVDAEGRSCVVREEVEFGPTPDGALRFALAHRTPSVPPPPRPDGRADLVDLQVPPGIVTWAVLEYEPGRRYPTHHTDTVDFDVVLTGSIDLVLDDGAHHLEPGDGVVVHGVDHGWEAGPAGCRLSVVSVGTPPPA